MLHIDRSKVKKPGRFRSDVCRKLIDEANVFYERPPKERAQLRHSFKLQQFIDDEIVDTLKALFNSKCAYCETSISHPTIQDIDHFRPYRGALDLYDSESLDHYYWLAYDWNNYYLCCPSCKESKQAYFPVLDNRAEPGTTWSNLDSTETRSLLDPCNDTPPNELVFLNDGTVISAVAFDESSELTVRDRAFISVEILGLNRKKYVDQRQIVIESALKGLEDAVLKSAKGGSQTKLRMMGYENNIHTEWVEFLSRLYGPHCDNLPYLTSTRQSFVRKLAELLGSRDARIKRAASKLLDLCKQYDNYSYRLGRLVNQSNILVASERTELLRAELVSLRTSESARHRKTDRSVQDQIDSLMRFGDEKQNHGQLDNALREFKEGLKLSRKIDDSAREIDAIIRVSGVYMLQGDFDAAADELNAARSRAEEIDDKYAQEKALLNLGNLAYNRGNFPQSGKLYSDALEIAESLRDLDMEKQILANLGSLNLALGRYVEAEDYLNQALKLANETDDLQTKAMTQVNLGNLARARKSYEYAQDLYIKAQELFETLNNRHGLAVCALSLGNVHQQANRFAEALENYQTAAENYRILGDVLNSSKVSLNLGKLYMSIGDFDLALKKHMQALKQQRSIGAQALVAQTLVSFSILLRSLNRIDEAEDALQEAISISQHMGDLPTAVLALESSSQIKMAQGDLEGAFDDLQNALAARYDIRDQGGIARGLINLGNIYLIQDDYDNAKSRYIEAIKLLVGLDQKHDLAQAKENLGMLHQRQGEFIEAEECIRNALILHGELGDQDGMARMNYHLGVLHLFSDDTLAAAEHFNAAIVLAQQGSDVNQSLYIAALAYTYQVATQTNQTTLVKYFVDLFGQLPEDLEDLATQFRDDSRETHPEISSDPTMQSSVSGIRDAKVQALSIIQPYIEKVCIRNFKGIRNLEFIAYSQEESNIKDAKKPSDAKHMWTVFLGENGLGKSTILQSICLALAGDERLRNLRQSEECNITPESIRRKYRRKDGRTIKTPRSSVHVKLSAEQFTRKLYIDKNNFHFPDRASRKGINGVLCAYSIVRMFPRKTSEAASPVPFNVTNLFNPTEPLINPTTWLNELSESEFDSVASVVRGLLVQPHNVMEQGESLKNNNYTLSRDGERVYVETEDCPIGLEFISDGYASVIALACDIMYNAGVEFQQMQALQGIVLVDEIGNNLHPRWKMRIVRQLREAFPNIQFIVTTHEPLCLRGVEADETCVLFNNADKLGTKDIALKVNIPDPSKMRVDQLLTSPFFGLHSAIDPEVEDLYNEYYSLLSKAKKSLTPKDKQRIASLRKDLRTSTMLGSSWRDQLVMELIDDYIAKNGIQAGGDHQLKVDDRTKERVFEIWNSAAFLAHEDND